MNYKVRVLPFLTVSALGMRCATTQTALRVSETPPVKIECRYAEPNKLNRKSEIDCTLVNQGDAPAQIRIQAANFEDPDAKILPVDISRVQRGNSLETLGVAIGVIVIIGVIVALAASSKSGYMPNLKLPLPESSSPPPKRSLIADDQRNVFPRAFELPGRGSVLLILAVEHGIRRPKTFLLKLDGAAKPVEVPIKSRFSERGRTDF
jgi:hypothetical protein